MRCSGCSGTGSLLGLGMIKGECPRCEGKGKVVDAKTEAAYLRSKDPDAFDTATQRIKAADKTLTDDDAADYLVKGVKKERRRYP